jgi:hypothetical protein
MPRSDAPLPPAMAMLLGDGVIAAVQLPRLLTVGRPEAKLAGMLICSGSGAVGRVGDRPSRASRAPKRSVSGKGEDGAWSWKAAPAMISMLSLRVETDVRLEWRELRRLWDAWGASLGMMGEGRKAGRAGLGERVGEKDDWGASSCKDARRWASTVAGATPMAAPAEGERGGC